MALRWANLVASRAMTQPQGSTRGTTFRLESHVRRALEHYATRTRRSLNSAVNELLAAALANELDDQRQEVPQ